MQNNSFFFKLKKVFVFFFNRTKKRAVLYCYLEKNAFLCTYKR